MANDMPDAGDEGDMDTLRFAHELVRAIAEDPMVRPSYRLKAREHLKKLRASAVRALNMGEVRADRRVPG